MIPTKAKFLRGLRTSDVRAVMVDVAVCLAQQVDRASDLQLDLQEATVPIEPSHLGRSLKSCSITRSAIPRPDPRACSVCLRRYERCVGSLGHGSGTRDDAAPNCSSGRLHAVRP